MMRFPLFLAALAFLSPSGCVDHNITTSRQLGLDPEAIIDITTKVFPSEPKLNAWAKPSVVWGPQQNTIVFEVPPGFGHRLAAGKHILHVSNKHVSHLGSIGSVATSPEGNLIAYYDEIGDVVIARITNGIVGDKKTVYVNADPAHGYDNSSVWQGSGLAWSPDGRTLVFSVSTEIADWKASPNLSLDYPISTDLYAFDLPTEESELIYRSTRAVYDISWVPGRNAIVFVEGFYEHRRDVEYDPNNYRNDIYRLDISTRQKRLIAADVGVTPGEIRLSPAPDGNTIGFFVDAYLIKPSSLGTEPAVVGFDGSDVQLITERSFLAHNRAGLTWSRNGRTVIYPCKRGGLFSLLCTTNPHSRKTKLVNLGQTEEILSIDINPDSDRMVRMSQDVYDILRIKVSNLDGENEHTLLEIPRIDLRDVALGEVKPIHWRSGDGLQLTGMLVLPVNYVEGRRYPVLVDIHGGPSPGVYLRGALGVSTPLEWQIWAAEGYAVFVTDYRFSGAYGLKERYLRRPKSGNLYDVNTDDILTGVDHLYDIGLADPNKLAVIGHSYGSMFTNWILTRTDRFKVAISKEGDADKRDQAAHYCRKNPPTCLWPLRATMQTLDKISAEHSAILKARNVNTPVLLIGARFGAGNPEISDLRAFSEAINFNGGHAEYLYFDDDYHIFRNPANIRKTFYTSLDWIDHYLKEPTQCLPAVQVQ